ncbi:MAG: hypothetical protein PUC26_02710 [Eubacteriales bacterium]|jgi:hypothetical protein|nr:hypothetical protein [Eubacteriales bacterium]
MDMTNTITEEELLQKVRELGESERFKAETAFFMCGFPTEEPNETLAAACEKYVDSFVEKAAREAAGRDLVKELEAAAAKKPKVADVDNIMASEDAINELLQHKEYLLQA